MSKEIARTVGGKKFAGLLAILALIAVFATVGSQWKASASSAPGHVYVHPSTLAFSLDVVANGRSPQVASSEEFTIGTWTTIPSNSTGALAQTEAANAFANNVVGQATLSGNDIIDSINTDASLTSDRGSSPSVSAMAYQGQSSISQGVFVSFGLVLFVIAIMYGSSRLLDPEHAGITTSARNKGWISKRFGAPMHRLLSVTIHCDEPSVEAQFDMPGPEHTSGEDSEDSTT